MQLLIDISNIFINLFLIYLLINFNKLNISIILLLKNNRLY